jgi:hypothetical protein
MPFSYPAKVNASYWAQMNEVLLFYEITEKGFESITKQFIDGLAQVAIRKEVLFQFRIEWNWRV